jgi:hypothetical protein
LSKSYSALGGDDSSTTPSCSIDINEGGEAEVDEDEEEDEAEDNEEKEEEGRDEVIGNVDSKTKPFGVIQMKSFSSLLVDSFLLVVNIIILLLLLLLISSMIVSLLISRFDCSCDCTVWSMFNDKESFFSFSFVCC